MIESPQEAMLFDPISTSEEDAHVMINKDPEVLLVKQRFLTSSFRATIRHLKAKGGFGSRFRGISMYIAQGFAVQFVASLSSAIPFFPRSLSVLLASVACAPLSLAWTHIVISDSSPKRWFSRIPKGLKIWKKVAVPTALLAIAEQLTVVIPLAISYGVDLQVPKSDGDAVSGKQLVAALPIGILAIILGVVLIIPANVILTRVQASLLDDAEETIVPFDRSFGGKVEPEIVGGSGVIVMLDAWKTFDWNARVRLVKAYLKVWGMQMVLAVSLIVTLAFELFLIVGKDWSKLMPQNPEEGGKN